MKENYHLHHFEFTEADILNGKLSPYELSHPLWWTVSIYDGPEQYNADLTPYTLPQRYIFALQWYRTETENGGHDQFFFNSTGIVWKDALKGMEAIGCQKGVEILQEAAKRMGGSPSLDREERWTQLDALNPDFEDLDRQYYALEEEEAALTMKYIQQHPREFLFSGDVEVPDFLFKD